MGQAIARRSGRLAGLALLGVGAGLGVDQRKARHPPRRPAQDLEGDVAAHRQGGQREAGGGRGQHPLGETAHRVGMGEVGHEHLAARLEGRELGGPEPVVAEQAGQEDGRLGHGSGPLSGSGG